MSAAAGEEGNPLVRNVASAKQVREAKKKQGLKKRLANDDILWLWEQPQFRRWLSKWVTKAGLLDAKKQSNEEQQFDAGRRNTLVRQLNEILEAHPDALLEMMQADKTEKENG